MTIRGFRPDEEVSVQPATEHVGLIEFQRPPHNYFDGSLIEAIADAYEELARDSSCRAIVLCSEGKNFCAGANFAGPNPAEGDLYEHAVVCSPGRSRWSLPSRERRSAAVGRRAFGRFPRRESRFALQRQLCATWHPSRIRDRGTLPLVESVEQRALELLYTGIRLRGEDAHTIGLCDRLVAGDQLRDEAVALAEEIASSSPLAVRAIRRTMRGALPGRIRAATACEAAEQAKLFATEDFREGVAAAAERRPPQFRGR